MDLERAFSRERSWRRGEPSFRQVSRRMLSAARPRPVRDEGEDDHDDQESDPAHSHQARVSDGSRFLRLDPCDRSDSGYEDCETEPYEPVHDGRGYKM